MAIDIRLYITTRDYEGEVTNVDCIGTHNIKSYTLRDACSDLFKTNSNKVDGISYYGLSDSNCGNGTWFTVVNGAHFETGEIEERALFVDGITVASKSRLFQLLLS